MGRHCNFLLVLIMVCMAGCARHPLRTLQGDDSSLQRWVDGDLTPWLAQQLGQHPRFRGEPVILVRLDGPDIQPDIDGLTRSLRDQLRDSLLTAPGVRLSWQPQQQQAQHHRRLEQVRCGRIRDAGYYIGIEITRTVTAEFRVSVRALDVRAGEWVSGFARSWTGSLTSSELRALQEQRTDESLRGLRVLPFSAGQPDLAATYLANNLSCLLRQQEEEDLVVHVEPLRSGPAGLRTLLELVGNNLSRYREVRVTDAGKEANFILRGEAHEVQPGLYQVWVVLHPEHSAEHLTGMDTATYVRIPTAGDSPGERALARNTRTGKPAIARMELVRRQGGSAVCEEVGHGTFDASHAGDACRVLEMSVDQADRVFVFTHGTKEGFNRLSDGVCRHSVVPVRGSLSRHTFLLPEAPPAGSDWQTIYAIAVNDPEPAQQATRLLGSLPDACSGDTGRRMENINLERWLDELDRLVATHAGHIAWNARRLP